MICNSRHRLELDYIQIDNISMSLISLIFYYGKHLLHLRYFINAFTKAAFVDFGENPRDNDLLISFVIRLNGESQHSFMAHKDVI